MLQPFSNATDIVSPFCMSAAPLSATVEKFAGVRLIAVHVSPEIVSVRLQFTSSASASNTSPSLSMSSG